MNQNLNPVLQSEDVIVALATPPGIGAIGLIRLSGKKAIEITNMVFDGKDLIEEPSHTIHLGKIKDGNEVIDEVLVSLFKEPHSYTKENVVEISCHGSNYVIKEILSLMIRRGARYAQPGEFTQRAFIHGRFDLAQAEAVVDLIESDSKATHSMAMNQMRGGFSKEINELREKLIHFASLIELELDFSEEDVEFASRNDLKDTIVELREHVQKLVASFQVGNVLKNGIPTVIVGKPNSGKSTLLNTLLNEERAIVSDIPGTTRDFIEDEIFLDGIRFRFIDTAGLRETVDAIEAEGVSRTKEKMQSASLILYVFDIQAENKTSISEAITDLEKLQVPYLVIANKMDQATPEQLDALEKEEGMILISASEGENLDGLRDAIIKKLQLSKIEGSESVVSNIRHVEALQKAEVALDNVMDGLNQNLTHELLAHEIRQALFHLGEITGEISTDDLLENIFSRFCIGK